MPFHQVLLPLHTCLGDLAPRQYGADNQAPDTPALTEAEELHAAAPANCRSDIGTTSAQRGDGVGTTSAQMWPPLQPV
ncbi:hypothetical protein SKAU_G00016020 [Synaphobranchus kaupii]|uniref:Uncharacterized protein n=1 Tax=Synaphobranchus kaupii TaxID=118154 RepID=A0A9Q1GB01_SYNKA|nr:hypothetical protein SKAU_G00016020 [Synaphobranchus kaupii]